jgi:hypothetical protein
MNPIGALAIMPLRLVVFMQTLLRLLKPTPLVNVVCLAAKGESPLYRILYRAGGLH